jgi:hypothetical protein
MSQASKRTDPPAGGAAAQQRPASVVSQPPAQPPQPSGASAELIAEAARQLGMATKEIIDVRDTKAGRVITTHDGHACIVPADKPGPLDQRTDVRYYPQAGVPIPRELAVEIYDGDGDVA